MLKSVSIGCHNKHTNLACHPSPYPLNLTNLILSALHYYFFVFLPLFQLILQHRQANPCETIFDEVLNHLAVERFFGAD